MRMAVVAVAVVLCFADADAGVVVEAGMVVCMAEAVTVTGSMSTGWGGSGSVECKYAELLSVLVSKCRPRPIPGSPIEGRHMSCITALGPISKMVHNRVSKQCGYDMNWLLSVHMIGFCISNISTGCMCVYRH